jgi:hypothetical protein
MKASDGGLDSAEFQRAFIAVRYAAGIRGDELVSPFERMTEGADRLATALSAGDRNRRAQALAAELGEVARLLDARRLR